MADELTNILGKRAAFAATFGDTTNLAQRRRYQEDIAKYQDASTQEDQRQFDVVNRQAELANPLKARSVRVAENRLSQQDEQFKQRMSLDEGKFALAQETAALREFQAQAQVEREMRAVRDAKRIEEDTLAVEREEDTLRQNGILPGSSEYGQRITEKLIRHPYTKPNYSEMLLKQAKVEVDPETLISQWAAKGRKPVVSETIHPDGRTSLTIREATTPEVTPEKQQRDMEKEVERLQNSLLSAKGSPMEGYYKRRIQETNAKLLGLSQPQGTAAQTAKPLDRDTAASILKEFGGDKDKARQAAKDRGYTF